MVKEISGFEELNDLELLLTEGGYGYTSTPVTVRYNGKDYSARGTYVTATGKGVSLKVTDPSFPKSGVGAVVTPGGGSGSGSGSGGSGVAASVRG